MSDFFQAGEIATLHRFGGGDVARLERALAEFAAHTPIALVLPCHAREIGSAALERIVSELRSVRYLRQIVVGLDGATHGDAQRARELFAQLPQKPLLIWNDGPRLQRLLARAEEAGWSPAGGGKGRNVWLGCGLVLASGQARIVALHDCDIENYDREMLARLCYPVAHPGLGFDFCKGYYARVAGQLNGRVMRLLLAPLLCALDEVVPPGGLLEFWKSFRYPLAGEIALRLDLLERLRLPFDWSLEVGLLAEVYAEADPQAVCQSELCGNYDHAHQDLSPDDPRRGLHRMAIDIATMTFHHLSATGSSLVAPRFDLLFEGYARHAENALRLYAADAAVNGLQFPRQEEERAVATFTQSIRAGATAFLENPGALPLLASWNRVRAELPTFAGELLEAAEQDRAEAGY